MVSLRGIERIWDRYRQIKRIWKDWLDVGRILEGFGKGDEGVREIRKS